VRFVDTGEVLLVADETARVGGAFEQPLGDARRRRAVAVRLSDDGLRRRIADLVAGVDDVGAVRRPPPEQLLPVRPADPALMTPSPVSVPATVSTYSRPNDVGGAAAPGPGRSMPGRSTSDTCSSTVVSGQSGRETTSGTWTSDSHEAGGRWPNTPRSGSRHSP